MEMHSAVVYILEIQSTVAYTYGNALNYCLYIWKYTQLWPIYIWKYTQLWPINMEIHSTVAYRYRNTLNCCL